MKISALAARDARAQERLIAAAESLGNHLGVEIPKGVYAQRGRPPERAMQAREAVADLLESIWDVVSKIEYVPPPWQVDPPEDAWHRDFPDPVVIALVEAGFDTARDIHNASDGELLAVDGVGPATLRRLREGS